MSFSNSPASTLFGDPQLDRQLNYNLFGRNFAQEFLEQTYPITTGMNIKAGNINNFLSVNNNEKYTPEFWAGKEQIPILLDIKLLFKNNYTLLSDFTKVEDLISKLASTITPKISTNFTTRFNNSALGKNIGVVNAGLNTANTLFTGIFGEKNEYSGDKGDVAQTMDSAYDATQSVVSMIPGIGLGISALMSLNKLGSNVANKLGAGTDGMTVQDSILGSAFFLLSPLGLINGFGGKRADTITKNELAFETVGSSYTGTNQTVNDALTKSGKKYGLFSSRARRKANEEITEAKRQQEVMEDIANEATDRFNLRNSMAAINENRRTFLLQGGYNLSNIRVGKSGMSLDLIAKAKKVLHESKKLKEGGLITPTEILLVIPELIEDKVDIFKEGGSINVIPEGALHAHKHNMDIEGITKKGIPVVSDKEGGGVEQLAEIERSEIIYRKSVTEELEKLCKIYYNEDTSLDEKDEAALKAGKLLVEETLYNTQDNTGLINEVL